MAVVTTGSLNSSDAKSIWVTTLLGPLAGADSNPALRNTCRLGSKNSLSWAKLNGPFRPSNGISNFGN